MNQPAQTNHAEKREQIEKTLRLLIKERLREEIAPERIELAVPLQDQGLDSFEFVRLLITIEDAFGVVIGDEELTFRPMDTLEELVTLVADLQG